MDGNRKIWEERYSKGMVLNKYPYTEVVSFVLRNFANSNKKNIKILDYGSGGGNHTFFLAAEGFDFYSIDYSSSAVSHTIKTLKSLGINIGENKVICTDFIKLPFNDDFFDAIIDRQSLGQNKANDIPKMVNEIYRVLKSGGLYWGINFSDRDQNIKYGENLNSGDFGNFKEGTVKNLGHRHFFSQNEIRNVFSDFEIEDIKIKRVESLLTGSGSEEIIVQAKKRIS